MQRQKFQFHDIPYNAGIKWWEIQSSWVNTFQENVYIKLTWNYAFKRSNLVYNTQLDTQTLFYKQ